MLFIPIIYLSGYFWALRCFDSSALPCILNRDLTHPFLLAQISVRIGEMLVLIVVAQGAKLSQTVGIALVLPLSFHFNVWFLFK